MDKNHTSTMLKLTQAAFFATALVWLVTGMFSLFLAIDVGTATRWVYTVLMFVNAAVLFWFGRILASKRNWVFFFAILYIALNVVLSITDQFGVVDAFILFLSLCLLGFLFVTRQQLLRNEG